MIRRILAMVRRQKVELPPAPPDPEVEMRAQFVEETRWRQLREIAMLEQEVRALQWADEHRGRQ
jgi:hypothetical protein